MSEIEIDLLRQILEELKEVNRNLKELHDVIWEN